MKKFLLLTTVIASCLSLQAKQVDTNKAKSIALQFMESGSTTRSARSADLNLVYTATSNDASPATRSQANGNNLFYVFNQSDDKGFVIVAADDAVSPILAYSRENSFKADNMPCNVKVILDGYRSAIAEAIANGNDASSEWSDVGTRAEDTANEEYLLKTKWDQGWPFNAQTPKLAGEHCATGCVATAMAQIMYYWKYPQIDSEPHSYHWLGGDKTLSADMSKNFDWENMRNTYASNESFTEAEVQAVSHLMLQCGIYADMNYFNASSATKCNAEAALSYYLGYSKKSISNLSLDQTGQTKWMRIVKGEIDSKRPVLYTNYGHAFVCDGYDSSDRLHLNLGWGGSSDGFYKFMADDSEYITLNPQSTP